MEPLDVEVNLGDCYATADDLHQRLKRRDAPKMSAWDAELCAPLHAALRPALSRRDASDPRFWQWLCTRTHLRDLVWLRWHGLVPGDPDDALADSDLARRFVGSDTLVGISRNGLARPYWTVETMCDGNDRGDGVDLAKKVLAVTDLHSGILERLIGLHPPAARAAVSTLADLPEDPRREALLRLNQLATTTLLETLHEHQVSQLLKVHL